MLASVIAFAVLAPTPIKAADDYYMIVFSDPQYPWNELVDGTTRGNKEMTAAATNAGHVAAMNAIVAKFPGKVRGAIVNGDLTAYGHEDELEKFKTFYAAVRVPLYIGLGNHDYANNVNNTYLNAAARRMCDYAHSQILQRFLSGAQNREGMVINADWTVGATYYDKKKLTNRRDFSGSLAYSFEFGNVHFVQLNNYPTYVTSFDGWNVGEARHDYYSIHSALPWLKKDLENARARGKKILLNFHDKGQAWDEQATWWTNDILARYDVSGIFVGHLHQLYGQVGGVTLSKKSNRLVPIFFGGSALYEKFTLLHVTGNTFTVQGVDSKDGKLKLLQTWGPFSLY